MRDTRRQASEGNRYTASSSTCLASKASACDIRQPQTVPVSNPSAFPFSFSCLAPHQSSAPNHPATKKPPLALRLPGKDPSNPMRGQSPIPKVAFALPHLITPVATAALLVPELLPTGPRQSAAAVPERHAPNQRHHRRSRVP
ncbi:hypothetical protein CPAR01_10896 [Colletotrichum paranaense]|uniref:Uncharacterized protein n=1 Tax=Colletotrichum paranaense TaxID=1914294 RepID=A0ABQ9SA33_9PEZI|nr:uncharacterized protein CPAR01_10896 [Colletotrichum paranaense]KAK1531247.1 hypothetical protein CPAR01_10896 [Colletotrichum paranaense]